MNKFEKAVIRAAGLTLASVPLVSRAEDSAQRKSLSGEFNMSFQGNNELAEDVCAALLPLELRDEFFRLQSEERLGNIDEGSAVRLQFLRERAKSTLARADNFEMA